MKGLQNFGNGSSVRVEKTSDLNSKERQTNECECGEGLKGVNGFRINKTEDFVCSCRFRIASAS